METLADGEHEGVRWWLQRLDGLPGLQLTVSGYVGSNPVIAYAEFGTADPIAIEDWLTQLLTQKRAGWSKRAKTAATSAAAFVAYANECTSYSLSRTLYSNSIAATQRSLSF